MYAPSKQSIACVKSSIAAAHSHGLNSRLNWMSIAALRLHQSKPSQRPAPGLAIRRQAVDLLKRDDSRFRFRPIEAVADQHRIGAMFVECLLDLIDADFSSAQFRHPLICHRPNLLCLICSIDAAPGIPIVCFADPDVILELAAGECAMSESVGPILSTRRELGSPGVPMASGVCRIVVLAKRLK